MTMLSTWMKSVAFRSKSRLAWAGNSSSPSQNAVDITPQLNVYTLFRYALPGAKLSGEWVPFRDLKDGGPFAVLRLLGDDDVQRNGQNGRRDDAGAAEDQAHRLRHARQGGRCSWCWRG